MRRLLVPVVLALLPLAPATAVVALESPVRSAPQAPLPPPEPVDKALSFGEIAAAVGGLLIFAVAVGSRRRSVAA